MPGLPRSGAFHPECPYYQGETKGRDYPPLCRLREEFEDGSFFVGDSFGDSVWIDAKTRCCPSTCLCHSLGYERVGAAAEKDVFAFTVTKSSDKIQFHLHSEDLRCEVLKMARPSTRHMEEPLIDGTGALNGHALLDCRTVLLARLSERQLEERSVNASRVTAELSLLVHGTLRDVEMLKRFGLRGLHEQGRLDIEQWVAVQTADCNRRILTAEVLSELSERPDFNLEDLFGKFVHDNLLGNSLLDYSVDWGQVDFEVADSHELEGTDKTPEKPPSLLKGYTPKPEPYVITTDSQVLRERMEWRGSWLELQRQDLVSKYEVPETFLLKAVRDCDVPSIRTLLHHARDESQVDPSVPAKVLDLDGVLEETTALIEAVRGGYLRIAKMLIQHGADVNIMTASHETALTVAAKAGSETMLRLLLAYGADVHVAVLMLRVDEPAGPGVSAINRLTASAARYQRDVFFRARKVRKEVVRLGREFHDEHCRMLQTADTRGHVQCRSTGTGESDMRRYGLEGRPRKAWCIALRTLRGLCRGTLPSNLNETLLFIALSKVMSSIAHGKDDAEAAAELNQDLGRWQLLFNPEDGGLDAFQRAVMMFWGIDTSTLDATPSPSEDVLAAFQDMALSCFSRASGLYETEGMDELGLISTQNRWRERQREEIPTPGATCTGVSYVVGDKNQVGDDGESLGEAAVERLEFDILLDPPKPPPPLYDEPTPYQRLFVLLIAGAIFAAAIAFLLLIREGPTPSDSPSTHDSPYAGPPVESPIKHLFKSRPTRPTGKRARGTLRDLLAARSSEDSRLERTERTYYLLAAYLGLPPCQSVPTTTRKRRRRPPVEPVAPSGSAPASSSGSALPSSQPASETGRRSPKKAKITFCADCQREFHTTSNLGRHRKGPAHKGVRYHCSFPGCGKSYGRNYVREAHEREKHGGGEP